MGGACAAHAPSLEPAGPMSQPLLTVGIAERADGGRPVGQPQRARQGLEVFEARIPVRPVRHVSAFVRRQAEGGALLEP